MIYDVADKIVYTVVGSCLASLFTERLFFYLRSFDAWVKVKCRCVVSS